MKSYLFSIPDRLKRHNETLDAQAILCDKSWEVFNDEGIKQIFIFEPDGNLIVSTNGDCINASWKYIAVNQSLLINDGKHATMLHPEFVADMILALQKDGTNEIVFLIDEKDQTILPQRTLNGLTEFFNKREQKLIAEDAIIAQKEVERKAINRQEEEAKEKARLIHDEEVNAVRLYINKNYLNIRKRAKRQFTLNFIFVGLFFLLWGGGILMSVKPNDETAGLSLLLLVLAFIDVIIFAFCTKSYDKFLSRCSQLLTLDEIKSIYKDIKKQKE